MFTKNPTICGGFITIWPLSINQIEQNLYFFILPYLIIFDMLVQNGQITKIFIVVPLYYIYTLFRLFWYIFNKLFTKENNDLSEEVYEMR